MQGLAGHQVSAGSSGGSDPALFTQAVQIPDMLSWNAAEIAGYTWPIGHEGQVIRIGQTLYCYGGGARGGATHAKIYSTAWSDPKGWVDTGQVLPMSMLRPRIVMVNSNLLLFGDAANATLNIYSTPVTTPLTWGASIGTVPLRRDTAQVVIVEGKAAIHKGHSGAAGIGTTDICADVVGAPATWATDARNNGASWECSHAAVYGKIMVCAGAGTPAAYYLGPAGDPGGLTLTNASGAFTQNGTPGVIHVGNSLWILGTATTTQSEVPVTDQGVYHTGVHLQNAVQPVALVYSTANWWIGPTGILYVPQDSTGKVYSTKTKTIYIQPEAIPSTRTVDAYDAYGNKTHYTRSCRLGFAEWRTNRLDVI